MNAIHDIFLRGFAILLCTAFIAPSLYAQTAITITEPESAVDLVDAISSGQDISRIESVGDSAEDIIPGSDGNFDDLSPEGAPNEELVGVNTIEIPSLIDDSTGIGNFDYNQLLGASGEWDVSKFFNPIETTPTANALVKDKAMTPDIYWAIKELLTKDNLELSAEEKSALLNTYFEREGELIFVTNDKRYVAYESARDNTQKEGLPKSRYAFDFPQSSDPIEKMALSEIEAAAFTLRYSKDMERGIVEPNSLGSQFDITPEGRSENEIMKDFAISEDPNAFFAALEPKDPDYAVLKAELAKYESLYLAADTAHIPTVPDQETLKLGSKGQAVVILRQRLDALGFKTISATNDINDNEPDVAADISADDNAEVIAAIAAELTSDVVPVETPVSEAIEQAEPQADVFDEQLAQAVKDYQSKSGLMADGIAGPSTLKTINNGPRAKMEPLLIAMERHRWGAESRDGRQIYVNLASYMAEVRDDNKKTFETRVVIGKNDPDYKTPELHDEMEYLVINPEWNVPHSIGTKEMLPRLQRGGGLGSTFRMVNGGGKTVNPANVDFNKYTEKTFPYRFIQENGPSNALGNVKFIFPNRHHIYLHDTPTKNLFSKNYRAYSHGCVRVGDPVDLATFLMAPYFKNPRASYDDIRATKKQRFVEMKTKIPVFLTYFTTFVDDAGQIKHVSDVYNRDRLVKNALAEQGVVF